MNNMNPIVKNERFKFSWFDKPPIVPEDKALILYPHASREHCHVFLQEDTVYSEAIRKWHLDMIAYVTLVPFEFQHNIKYLFANGVNQWVNVTYDFNVAVKHEKEAVKYILRNNIIDISEPILEMLKKVTLEESYIPVEIVTLQNEALHKIRELLSQLPYLKITVTDVNAETDEISRIQIENDKEDKIRKENNEALRRKLKRDSEEADAKSEEIEIARKKMDHEIELDDIRYQKELNDQQHKIEIKTREVAADKEYQLQKEKNTAAIAQEQMENMKRYGIEQLAAINPSYKNYISISQEITDIKRNNELKELEIIQKKLDIVSRMVQDETMDDATAATISQQLLLGLNNQQSNQKKIETANNDRIDDENTIDISEVGRRDV